MRLHVRDSGRHLGVPIPPCPLLRSAARQWRVDSGIIAGMRSGVRSMLGPVIPNHDSRELRFVQVIARRNDDTAIR